MECFAKGCKEKHYGWIDFGFEGEDCPYTRMFLCEKHWKPAMKKVEELIEKERQEGKLGKSEHYAIVPPHITKEVLDLGGEDND